MEEEEFTALYRQMSGRLFSFAARRLSPQAADDAVALTFETVWDKRDECPTDPDGRVGWVFTICRYKILQESDRFHRKHHDSRFAHDFRPRPAVTADVSDSVVESAVGHWIYQQLSALERDLFDVAFMKGVSREQASAMLSISVGTFTTRVSRLRARIKTLQALADESEPSIGKGAS
ncbi:RNA polymerase sigma factor [Aeromicrobium sp. 9AM]|uniref:RNA polymerase sigma factor n=1 Tax=Aeromicrobium sp. 9AM TaxID=2653126 RepID=UPI0012F27DFF|nr:sigma-70 family RNA polymerase sigma factor [Aeromicrobium sp. 9AM]VXB03718.1 conserved hypothetical protein [Aeromicrobium sp. 9AM]